MQETSRGAFPNGHLLVDTDWVAKHKADKGLRLVDVRSARDYGLGHIPGAVSIPTKATFAPKGPSGVIGSAEQVAKLFGAQGIDLETRVVLYDEGRSTAAARVFWTLEVFGHRKVSVVDGGFARWKADDRELTKEATQVTSRAFKPKQPASYLSTMDTVLEDVEDEEVVMLDARSQREFKGGRIPMAVHIEWLDNYTKGDVPIFKTPKDLHQLYTAAGVTSDKRVHAY